MFRRRVSEGKHEAAVPDGGLNAGSADTGGRLADTGGRRLADTGGTGPGPARPDPDSSGRDPAEPWGPPPAGLDVSTPHPARVWNYWLGGRDFFAADRAAGEEISREFPHLAQTARAERAFLVRVVRFLAGPARIRQFLDIGAGLPAGGNTHEIAQRIAPDTGIVYADNDPVVILHAKTLLASPGLASTAEGAVGYADADLRDVATVLAGAASTLDYVQAGRTDPAGHPRPHRRLRRGALDHEPAGGRAARGQLPRDRRRGGREPGRQRRAAAV